MEARKVVLTPKAEDDLREIFLYLSDFSLYAADAQAGRILHHADLLETFPRLGRVIPEYANDRLRELVVGDYLMAYYIVSEKQIDILAIHHASKPRRM